MDEVVQELKKRHHIVVGTGMWTDPVQTLTTIMNSDLAIFIFDWRPHIFHYFDRLQVMTELGIAVGSGRMTVVVGKAEQVSIIDHPWVRRMGLQELLQVIATTPDLSFIPPTHVNQVQEKERTDREEKL
jgi:hypothetical protein